MKAEIESLESMQKQLEKHDQKAEAELKKLEKGDNDVWGQDKNFENNQPLKEHKPEPGSFAAFMDNLFNGNDDVNQDPKEQEANGGQSPFPNIKVIKMSDMFKTGPVQTPHASINDLFANIAKPGQHPKFAEAEVKEEEVVDTSKGVQELKATNQKPVITETDRASGIVPDINDHEASVKYYNSMIPHGLTADQAKTLADGLGTKAPIQLKKSVNVEEPNSSKNSKNLRPKKIE